MIKKLSCLLFPAVLLASCSANNKEKTENDASQPPVIFAGYEELADPQPADPAAWQALDRPLYARFGSSDVRYPKSEVPVNTSDAGTDVGTAWRGSAWKGEKLNLQLLLWATEDIPAVKVRVSELSSDGGDRIPAEAATASFVRYVMTDEYVEGCGQRDPAGKDSSLVADVIDVIPELRIPAQSVRPVWIQIAVPREAAAGAYTGTITIENDGNAEVAPLTINLEVADRVLPPATDWDYHLDLWQNPFAESRMYEVENWSPEHFEAMEPSMQLLAGAGQKIITTSIIHDPWNSQTYDIYESMVRWVKKKDGSWEYDYTIFDKWVEYMSGLGIDQQINCYSMVPWNLKFYYYDESLGQDTVLIAEPGSAEYEAHWRPMLENFAAHLKEKGWFDKTTIAMDERPLEAMLAVIDLVKSVDPDFKIALAGNYHAELVPDVYDYCLASGQHITGDTIQLRRQQGMITTFYTCCAEEYPNTFTFSPPAEATWLSWHAAAKGYDGYLRWAYNCWVKDPLKDSRFRSWPGGDTFLVYPGGRSSIRFEKMIDGIEDYVKIRVLREEFEANGDTQSLAKLEALLEPFTDIPQLATVPAKEMLDKARAELMQF